MSPNNIAFLIVDSSNAGVTGLSLTFSTYRNQNGAVISSPGISEIGNGFYQFTPNFGYTNTAICYSIITSHYPSVVYGYTRWEDFNNITGIPNSPSQVVFGVFNNDNTGKTGLSLTFTTYKTPIGSAPSIPAIQELGSGFYRFFPVFDPTETANIYSINTGFNPVLLSGEIRQDDFLYSIVQPQPTTFQPQIINANINGQLTNLGTDFYDVTDQTLVDIVVSGEINLGQRIYRRLSTETNAMAYFDPNPNAGISLNLLDLVNAKLTPHDCVSVSQQIKTVVLAEEEVQSASVQVIPGKITTININLLTASGPFNLTIGVDNLNSTLLYNTPVINN